MNKRHFFGSADWRHDLRTFAAGAGCGVLAGALLVGTVLWQYHWIVPPWSPSRETATATRGAGDPGAQGIESAERPEGTAGRGAPAASIAPPDSPVPVPPATVVGPLPSSPMELKGRDLLIPVEGVRPEQLIRQFADERSGSRQHEALDILAPRGTAVRAVEDGTIARLFLSKPGGITVYQFDPASEFCYYYAHLERYADGLREGAAVRKGQVLGYVGTSGNAPKNTPHLHFAIFRLTEAKHWWEGTAIDPYDVLR